MIKNAVGQPGSHEEALYAHSTLGPMESWQPLGDHLRNVAALSAVFASPFGAEDWGRFVGLLHDVGKASKAFQLRLAGVGKQVDHATAGGQLAFELFHSQGEFLPALLAFPVMGHHGGLPEGGYASDVSTPSTLHGRRRKAVEDFPRWKDILPDLPLFPETLPRQVETALYGEQGFAAACFIRMLYSCLVDADWLDTEHFCNPTRFDRRPRGPSITEISARFDAFAHKNLRGSRDGNPAIQLWRRNILAWCWEAGKKPPGAFSLTVPTGGGKTFSSLAFALEHAKRHRMSRIIYVIPFTSIIEQNAAEFRRALDPLGDASVLEHHSSIREAEPDETSMETATALTDMRLAVENWDAPLIVTTAVQFFESLFACRKTRCRKLHNIADSVIVLDEAQMLPVPLLAPCVMALRELVRGYGATVVLCTATQPSLWYRPETFECGFDYDEVTELIPPEARTNLFNAFRRVSVFQAGTLGHKEVAERLHAERQGLVIVNTRGAARRIFESLGPEPGNYHLSAAMYPEHRSRRLHEIRQRLTNGEICRVVSTSLIEAGVDIDFPVVYREATGIDSIAQAAGRCNREGRLEQPGGVFVYTPEKPARTPFVQRRAQAARRVFEMYSDVLSPDAIEAYFDTLYSLENLDGGNILANLESALADDDFRKHPAIPFASVAAAFRFITEDTRPVVVESAEALPLIARLETTDDHDEARRLLRRLQSYTVQIYSKVARRLHLRELPRFGLFILSGATGYDENLGLVPDEPDLRRAEDNLF